MKRITVSNIEQLKKLLEAPGFDEVEIILEKGVYELYETIDIKRKNFTLNGNGATICGSKKISLPEHEDGEIVKLNLDHYGIDACYEYGKVPFDWCGKFIEGPCDEFGTTTVGLLNYDIPKYHASNGPGMELYYNGEAMPISRYPENGYMEIERAIDTGAKKIESTENNDCVKNGGIAGVFVPRDKTFTSFEKAEKALLFGYFAFDWAPHHHLVESVDAEKNIISVVPPYDFYGYWDGRGEEGERARFFAINVYGALGKEGSYFFDRETNELYVHPYKGQKELEISVCKNAFAAKDAENIRIKNLNISQCRQCAFFFKDSKNVLLSEISVKNVGEWAIIGERCTEMQAQNCVISHTGSGGIFLSGGDRTNLLSSKNRIFGCDISYGAKWYRTYKPGIYLAGVGTVVCKNKIHDLPHSAILYTGNNHVIENNEIYRVCNESNDAGAVYIGRSYTFYGNIIRHNYFHDLFGLDGKGCSCVYFDDCMSSAKVYGNTFENMLIPVQLGGGHDIEIYENTFRNCALLLVDARGKSGNWGNPMAKNMARLLSNSPYKNDAWKKAYPSLMSDDVQSEDFCKPMRNSIHDNTFTDCGGIYFERTVPDGCIEVKNNVYERRTVPKLFSSTDKRPPLFYYIRRDYVLKDE